MASQGNEKESGRISLVPANIPSLSRLFKERFKNVVTKMAMKEKLTELNKKNLDSDSESANREGMKNINGLETLDAKKKFRKEANMTGSPNGGGSVDSGSSEISFSSKMSTREENLEAEEGGYILCLIVLTSLLRKEGSESKTVLFRAMQRELVQSLKKAFCPDSDAGFEAEEVFEKMERLAEALTPLLGMEITEYDCRRALELLEPGDEEDCIDRKVLKNLRRGGFLQYFCDIVTIVQKF